MFSSFMYKPKQLFFLLFFYSDFTGPNIIFSATRTFIIIIVIIILILVVLMSSF